MAPKRRFFVRTRTDSWSATAAVTKVKALSIKYRGKRNGSNQVLRLSVKSRAPIPPSCTASAKSDASDMIYDIRRSSTHLCWILCDRYCMSSSEESRTLWRDDGVAALTIRVRIKTQFLVLLRLHIFPRTENKSMNECGDNDEWIWKIISKIGTKRRYCPVKKLRQLLSKDRTSSIWWPDIHPRNTFTIRIVLFMLN